MFGHWAGNHYVKLKNFTNGEMVDAPSLFFGCACLLANILFNIVMRVASFWSVGRREHAYMCSVNREKKTGRLILQLLLKGEMLLSIKAELIANRPRICSSRVDVVYQKFLVHSHNPRGFCLKIERTGGKSNMVGKSSNSTDRENLGFRTSVAVPKSSTRHSPMTQSTFMPGRMALTPAESLPGRWNPGGWGNPSEDISELETT